MKNFILLVFLFSFSIGKAQNQGNGQLSTFHHNLYSIQFPDGWTLDTVSAKLSGVDVFLFSSLESAADSFRENINILHQSLPPGVNTLSGLMDSTKPMIQEYFHLDSFIVSKMHVVNGEEYYQLEYPILQNGLLLHSEQYYFLKHNTVFVVTLSMQKGKELVFKKEGEKIMGSFQVNP